MMFESIIYIYIYMHNLLNMKIMGEIMLLDKLFAEIADMIATYQCPFRLT